MAERIIASGVSSRPALQARVGKPWNVYGESGHLVLRGDDLVFVPDSVRAARPTVDRGFTLTREGWTVWPGFSVAGARVTPAPGTRTRTASPSPTDPDICEKQIPPGDFPTRTFKPAVGVGDPLAPYSRWLSEAFGWDPRRTVSSQIGESGGPGAAVGDALTGGHFTESFRVDPNFIPPPAGYRARIAREIKRGRLPCPTR